MARRAWSGSLQETDEMGKMRGSNLPSRLVEGVLLLLEFTYHPEPGPGRQAWGRPTIFDGLLFIGMSRWTKTVCIHETIHAVAQWTEFFQMQSYSLSGTDRGN